MGDEAAVSTAGFSGHWKCPVESMLPETVSSTTCLGTHPLGRLQWHFITLNLSLTCPLLFAFSEAFASQRVCVFCTVQAVPGVGSAI